MMMMMIILIIHKYIYNRYGMKIFHMKGIEIIFFNADVFFFFAEISKFSHGDTVWKSSLDKYNFTMMKPFHKSASTLRIATSLRDKRSPRRSRQGWKNDAETEQLVKSAFDRLMKIYVQSDILKLPNFRLLYPPRRDKRGENQKAISHPSPGHPYLIYPPFPTKYGGWNCLVFRVI